MSGDLWLWRLWWNGRRGGARTPAHGTLRFARPPDLGFSYVELDYSPGIIAVVRTYPWSPHGHDLTCEEIAACKLFLQGLNEAPPPDLEADC